MTISIFLSKNYIHIKDSLLYGEYSIILIFLFIAIILSVTPVSSLINFSDQESEKKLAKELKDLTLSKYKKRKFDEDVIFNCKFFFWRCSNVGDFFVSVTPIYVGANFPPTIFTPILTTASIRGNIGSVQAGRGVNLYSIKEPGVGGALPPFLESIKDKGKLQINADDGIIILNLKSSKVNLEFSEFDRISDVELEMLHQRKI